MTPVEITLRDHRLCYAIELCQVHSGWLARWLYEGDHKLAVESYERLKRVAEGLGREMEAISAALKQADIIGRDAAEWRADRDGRHAPRRGAA